MRKAQWKQRKEFRGGMGDAMVAKENTGEGDNWSGKKRGKD